MVGFVKGIVDGFLPGRVLIDVNGLGVSVLISDHTAENLPSVGEFVKLYTHMAVREDDISLYGFISLEEQNLFNMLISVSGVGPKGALNILGTFSVSDIKYLIVTEDSKNLSKAPTIGKKIAEKIIIDLKDKINKEDIELIKYGTNNKNDLTVEATDAIDALVALGYDKKTAENAVSNIDHIEELDANQILKMALKYMF